MRTKFPVLFVFALGTAGLIWAMSGFGAVYGVQDPVTGLDSSERINNSVDNSVADEGGELQSSAKGSDNVVGIIFTSIGRVLTFAQTVALLPAELISLGAPSYAAIPLGGLATILVGIGVIQFASNRIYR